MSWFRGRSSLVPASDLVLRTSVGVAPSDVAVGRLVGEMWREVERSGGVGLAAPQVGVSVAVFVARLSFGDVTVIDPQVEVLESSMSCAIEGCLSLPELWFDVWRPAVVRVRARDGLEFVASGWDARIVGHEIDHLAGVLIDVAGTPTTL